MTEKGGNANEEDAEEGEGKPEDREPPTAAESNASVASLVDWDCDDGGEEEVDCCLRNDESKSSSLACISCSGCCCSGSTVAVASAAVGSGGAGNEEVVGTAGAEQAGPLTAASADGKRKTHSSVTISYAETTDAVG